MAKQKYYVVWKGKVPGIYTSWDECAEQVMGFEAAVYKSYSQLDEAEKAYENGPEVPPTSAGKSVVRRRVSEKNPDNPPDYRDDTVLMLPPEVSADAWAVDAACSGNPGKMEYRAVDLQTGAELFHLGPLYGTNNIGEFLAVVHALALLEKNGWHKTIYSDSRNALLWVRSKKCKTTLPRKKKTEPVYQLIDRAELWLNTHHFDAPLLKWQTSRWGEIPADFGRK